MKKIVFILALISLLSCSKNEEEAINPLKEKLIGSWRFVGFVTYDIHLPNGEQFEPYENGEIHNYFENFTFETIGVLNNNPYVTNGIYNINSLDSIIEYNHNQFNDNLISKITKLTSSVLELAPIENQIGNDNHLSISRYERVITP